MLSLPNYNQRLLIDSLLLMGDLFFNSKDFVNSASIYYFGIKTGNFTRNFQLQSVALQKLAKALGHLVLRKQAVNCLFKALEFAFYFDDYKQELNIYDALSKLYFEANELKMAIFYHRRVTEGTIEPADSVTRQLGRNETIHFIETCQIYKSVDYLEFFDLVLSLNKDLVGLCRLGLYKCLSV